MKPKVGSNMKERLLSGAVMIALLIPMFIIGGTFFNIVIGIIAVLGFKELLDVKKDIKNLSAKLDRNFRRML